MNLSLLPPPAMRLIKSSGVFITEAPILPPALADSDVLDRQAPDGRSHRQRFREAQEVVDLLAHGWRPGKDELQYAPTLSRWRPFLLPSGDIILFGVAVGHPYVRNGGFCATSPLIAYDAELALWMRTVSRWYRIGTPMNSHQTWLS